MKQSFTPAVLILMVCACVPLSTTSVSTVSKQIFYEDKNYEPYIGNVILNYTNPFIELGSDETVKLQFDLLTNQFENIQVRYIHCNFDWTPSQLVEMQYLQAFNRFDHQAIDYSVNTKKKYIQYSFELAQPFISGNYLVIAHRRNNADDILFTRRLVIYENLVTVNAHLRIPSQVRDRRTHQQIDFDLHYGSLDAPNPQVNIKTLILQNKNWNSALNNLPATVVQPGSKTMEWKIFSGENTFPGWNQFRFLDLRTLNLRGVNIAKIENQESGVMVAQGLEKSFGGASYRQLINDNNGRMIPGNSDPGESWLEADYAQVQFTVKSEKLTGKVYLTGRFNEWRKDESNLLRYDEENQLYFASIRLKQGYYDYRYEVESTTQPVYELEGSHYMAENEYDILIYYRSPGGINDQVVGLLSLNSLGFF